MLLTVAEAFSLCRDAAYEERSVALSFETEVHVCSGIGVDGHVLLLLAYHSFRLRVEELHSYEGCNRLVGGICHTGCHRSLVALSHEARHIRHHHHLLARHCLALYHSEVHLLVVGKAAEVPCGDALRQREHYIHIAVLVGIEGRIEEGCLVEVLANLRHGSRGSLFTVGILHASRASVGGIVTKRNKVKGFRLFFFCLQYSSSFFYCFASDGNGILCTSPDSEWK